MPNPYMYVSVVSVIEEVKKKRTMPLSLFPCSLNSMQPTEIESFQLPHLQRPVFVIALYNCSLSPPHTFSLSLSLSEDIGSSPPVLYDSVAATSTPLLPLLGAKLPSILLLASCISAFVGLSFC